MWVILLRDTGWVLHSAWIGMTPACAKLWKLGLEASPERMWAEHRDGMKFFDSRKEAKEIVDKMRRSAPSKNGTRYIRIVNLSNLDAYLVANELTK